MRADPVTIDASDVMKPFTMTITIRRARQLRARIWLGCIVLKIGAWITGVGDVRVLIS